MTQTYNNCAETHFGDGVMSPFVSPLSAIARALDPTLTSQLAGKGYKDSDYTLVIAIMQ